MIFAILRFDCKGERVKSAKIEYRECTDTIFTEDDRTDDVRLSIFIVVSVFRGSAIGSGETHRIDRHRFVYHSETAIAHIEELNQ